MRPISSELMHVWITGDGRKFFNESDAQKHQMELRRREQNERSSEGYRWGSEREHRES